MLQQDLLDSIFIIVVVILSMIFIALSGPGMGIWQRISFLIYLKGYWLYNAIIQITEQNG